jgi:DNA-binding NtrC family response regulator
MTRQVLVVDDDMAMVSTLMDILELHGWSATGAYSAREALAHVRRQAFDVVIMDIRMPGMDGIAAFRAMKELHPGIKVILTTAYSARELIRQAEDEGVLSVLDKPVDVDHLLGLLRSVAGASRPILLVDQDAAFLQSLAELLRVRAFAVVTASNVADAMRRLASDEPAAILLHLQIDTVATAETVLAIHEASPTVALVLYSGRHGELNELRESLPDGWVHGFLPKPFAIEELTRLLPAA